MDHDAYLAALREETEHFLAALADVAPDTPVPSCPGWTAADLQWHLAEVQHRWARIAEGAESRDAVPVLPRPADGDLATSGAAAGTELLTVLAARSPQTPSWSWHADGGTVGWIARRQAHEALIHRVDAELTAGRPVQPPVHGLAADGVDEVLRHYVDGLPGWGSFTADGTRVRLATTNDPERSWVLDLGRFTGTSPDSGETYDLDAAVLADDVAADPAAALADGEALVVRAPAWDLDLWLWGRGGDDALEVEGDRAVLDRLRALLTDATSV